MRRLPWLMTALLFLGVTASLGGLLGLDAVAAQPGPSLVVTPPSGTEVAPGQTVEFRLAVAGGPGAYRLSLTWLDTGERIGEATEATAVSFPFQVPVDAVPGQMLSFLAEAEGTTGRGAGSADEPFRERAQVELRVRALPGGTPAVAPAATPQPAPTASLGASPSPSPSAEVALEEWEGTFSFQVVALDGASNTAMFGTIVTGEFTFTVDRSIHQSGMFGRITGSGRAMRMTHGGRSSDCTVEYSHPPENLPFNIGGTLAEGTFLLVLSDPNPSTATITSICPGAPPMSTSNPVPADTGLHTFGIVMPAEDGARFTIDQRQGSLHEQGELTVRRRSAPGASTRLDATPTRR